MHLLLHLLIRLFSRSGAPRPGSLERRGNPGRVAAFTALGGLAYLGVMVAVMAYGHREWTKTWAALLGALVCIALIVWMRRRRGPDIAEVADRYGRPDPIE